MHFNVHAALFTVAKIWKQPKYPSTDEWIKKTQTCVCVCVCVCVYKDICINTYIYK